MNSIERFEFDHFNFSRIDDGTTVWFNAKQVAMFLGLSRESEMLTRVAKHHKRESISFGREIAGLSHTEYGTTWISEYALYRLVLRSNKPNAEPFADFVADTIVKLRSGKHPLQQRVTDLERVVANQAIELDKNRSVIAKYGEMRSTEYYSAILKRTITPEEARQLSRAMNTAGEHKSGRMFNHSTAKPDRAVIAAAKRLAIIDGETAYNLLESGDE